MELIGTWNFYYIFLTALIDVSKSFAIFLTITKSKRYLNCLVYVFFFFVFCCCFLVLKTHKYQTILDLHAEKAETITFLIKCVTYQEWEYNEKLY